MNLRISWVLAIAAFVVAWAPSTCGTGDSGLMRLQGGCQFISQRQRRRFPPRPGMSAPWKLCARRQ
jgi:hypothetical protein